MGAKAGISIPDLKGNNEQSKGYTSRRGIYAGLAVNFKLTPLISLQPEINFSPQGGQRRGLQPVPSEAFRGTGLPPGTDLYARFKSETILNYLEIPLLAKLTFGTKLKYYACFGPHIAFLLQAKTKTSGNSLLYLDPSGSTALMQYGYVLPPVSFNNTVNIKESIKTVNAGIQGGGGLQYPIGHGNIFFEGRAIIGLTNIQTHPQTDGENKTGSLAAAVGYLLKLK
ncbi:porin family protein [Segetibacter koreensis]|uniref:porin family protein n=1 Tax=Segetibacter koreensis TaxID=398037 RepID=UPI0024818635|nr:porin family protein [Segetibacter koreensis]